MEHHFQKSDFASMEKRFRAHLINSLGGFKSVCLCGTANKDGVTNLSVVSSVIHLGANPALMGFIMRPVTVTRHTYDNIKATRYYTLNHLNSGMYQRAHQASARYPEEVSEFEATGLTPYYSEQIPAPYVTESNVRIGLKLVQEMPIQLNGTILMIGQIEEFFVPETVIAPDGFIDIEAAGTLTCSGLDSYHTTQRLARLSYAKPDRPLTKIET